MTHTCVICKEKIIEKKERWVRLTDYDKKQITGETFYHLECWRDRFRISNSARKQKMYSQAQKAIGDIAQSFKNINIGNEKVYEIPAP